MSTFSVDANIVQIDEIRFEEDLPALGLNWIKLGLEDVLYDPKTNTVYTPNTNQTAVMGKLQLGGAKETEETPLQERANGGMIEDRGGRYIQGPDGKMQGADQAAEVELLRVSPDMRLLRSGTKAGSKSVRRNTGNCAAS